MTTATLDAEIREVESELREVEAAMREHGIDPDIRRIASEMAALEAAVKRRHRQVRLASLRELAAFARNVTELREQRRLVSFDPKRAARIRRERERKSD